jgi:SAM-dependent methyltransferase
MTLTKTFRKLQQWDRWLGHFPGHSVLSAEKKMMPSLLSQFYGSEVMLIGTPRQEVLLQGSLISKRIMLSPLPNTPKHPLAVSHIESELYELPVASGSLDLVILPHVLEYLDNPHHLLSEALRVIKPEGHIVICVFNPYSLWGLKKWWSKHDAIPWSGNFIKASLVKKWLAIADFKLIKHCYTLYQPPVGYEKLFNKLSFLEWLGQRFAAPFGGVYILIAQAKVIPLTPIKLRWTQKLSGMRIPTMGMPKPTARNHTQ